MERTIIINVIGKVQGVFFRKYTLDKANGLNLKGTVQNLNDGSVKVVVQGIDYDLKSMMDWVKTGSPKSTVLETIVEINMQDSFKEFKIISNE